MATHIAIVAVATAADLFIYLLILFYFISFYLFIYIFYCSRCNGNTVSPSAKLIIIYVGFKIISIYIREISISIIIRLYIPPYKGSLYNVTVITI